MNLSTATAHLRGTVSLYAFAILIAASACSADTRPLAQQGDQQSASKNQATQVAANDLNLLRAATPRAATARPVQSRVGSGSYMCSPAGSGRLSRCYSN
ncbi:hypothetical protein [Pseudophaeobacter arcticus]|jgi:hypothetical protein|uniref:hypothetical protein n=1 Tax=Pseudophaeobacter arcticus TaxID=385492 RepID=UPI0039E4F154